MIIGFFGNAQYDDYELAKIYLKNGEVLHGKARIPLEGRTFTPNFKEKIRFESKNGIVRYDETMVDSIVFDLLRYSFKVKINGKKVKKTIETSDKFVYKFLGNKFPQLVKEIKVGKLLVYEKFKRHNPGGPVSGFYRFFSPHIGSKKGLTDFGHYFFTETSDRDLQPLPMVKRFIDCFSFCPKLIDEYESFERRLHAYELIELLKSFDGVKKCN